MNNGQGDVLPDGPVWGNTGFVESYDIYDLKFDLGRTDFFSTPLPAGNYVVEFHTDESPTLPPFTGGLWTTFSATPPGHPNYGPVATVWNVNAGLERQVMFPDDNFRWAMSLTGEIPLGDGNADGIANQDDYDLWVSQFGQSCTYSVTTPCADFNRDGFVDAADYNVWRDNADLSQAVPEPNMTGLLLAMFTAATVFRRR